MESVSVLRKWLCWIGWTYTCIAAIMQCKDGAG